MKNNFSLINFSDYRKVSGQYTDDFIKNSLAVKIKEDENCVEICSVKDINNENLSSSLSIVPPFYPPAGPAYTGSADYKTGGILK